MSACPRIPTSRYARRSSICPGCRTELPQHATFCVECGLCMLDVTSEGTVVAPAPTEPPAPAPKADAVARPVRVLDDPSSARIQLDEADLEIDIDAMLADILIQEERPADPEDAKLTRRFERVPPSPETFASLAEDLSETLDEEIDIEVEVDEGEVDDDEIDSFIDGISSSRISLGRGPLTPLSQWPAPSPGQTVVGPAPTAA